MSVASSARDSLFRPIFIASPDVVGMEALFLRPSIYPEEFPSCVKMHMTFSSPDKVNLDSAYLST
jgi:hypothetical protein